MKYSVSSAKLQVWGMSSSRMLKFIGRFGKQCSCYLQSERDDAAHPLKTKFYVELQPSEPKDEKGVCPDHVFSLL
jgi:hypothetical protein